MGKWIEGDNGSIKCDLCGAEFLYSYISTEASDLPKYCPNCGDRKKKLKNIEYLIKALESIKESEDVFDDMGATEESIVYYNIACPYNMTDKRAHCYGHSFDSTNRLTCTGCKYEWLRSEVDE